MKISPSLSIALLAGSVFATGAHAQKSGSASQPAKRGPQLQMAAANPVPVQILSWQKVRRLDDGRLIPTSDVIPYVPAQHSTDFGEIRAFDRAEFGITAPFAPIGGNVCAGLQPSSRYYYGTAYIKCNIVNDFTVAAGATGDTDRFDLAYWWGVGVMRNVNFLVETYSTYNDCGTGVIPYAGAVDAVVITAAASAGGNGGYNTITWDPGVSGPLALAMPPSGSGATHIELGQYDSGTAVFTLDNTPGTQPMIWGNTTAGHLAGTTNPNEWTDTAGGTSDGVWVATECAAGGIIGCPVDDFSTAYAFWTTGTPPSGRCCFPNFAGCADNTEAQCAGVFGVWTAGLTCTANPCPTPPPFGACCTIAGCIIKPVTGCALVGNVYRGDGTVCPNTCAAAPALLFDNGPFDTGPVGAGGVAAPAGVHWSELQQNSTTPFCTNGTNAFGSGANNTRLADDFPVAGGGASVAAVVVPAYITGTSYVNASLFTGGTIRIWDRPPNDPAAVLEFGDTTTNRLGASEFAGAIRCPWSGAPNFAVPPTVRPLYNNWFIVPANLVTGNHWIDVALTQGGFPGTNIGFSPSITVVGARTRVGSNNAQVFNDLTALGVWSACRDLGLALPATWPCPTPPPVAVDVCFTVYGTSGTACYANCDHSTIPPCLNVLDFGCFLNKFASGDTTANCDASTIPPVLNVLDFGCFLNKFASGCSNC